MLKKMISLTTAITILSTSSGIVCFADSPMLTLPESEGIANVKIEQKTNEYETESNQFTYKYEETDYQSHLTTVLTEDDIAQALRTASLELNVLGFFAGGLALKPIAGAVQVATKQQLRNIVTKQLRIAGYIGLTERFASAGLTYYTCKAEKRVSEVKYKYKYQVHMLTQRKTLMSTVATYRVEIYTRENAQSSWEYETTETNLVNY